MPGTQRHRLNRQDGWHAGYILKLLRGHEVRGWYQPHRYINGKRVPEGEPIECYPRIIDGDLYSVPGQPCKGG